MVFKKFLHNFPSDLLCWLTVILSGAPTVSCGEAHTPTGEAHNWNITSEKVVYGGNPGIKILMWISKTKFLLVSLKFLANFENPLSNPLQKPHSGDLTLRMHTGSHMWSWKLFRKPAMMFSLEKSTNNRKAKTEIHQWLRRKVGEEFWSGFQKNI